MRDIRDLMPLDIVKHGKEWCIVREVDFLSSIVGIEEGDDYYEVSKYDVKDVKLSLDVLSMCGVEEYGNKRKNNKHLYWRCGLRKTEERNYYKRELNMTVGLDEDGKIISTIIDMKNDGEMEYHSEKRIETLLEFLHLMRVMGFTEVHRNIYDKIKKR